MEPALYQKLQEEDSIRLLILEPGDRNSPVSCRLVEARLSAKPIYNAVSYTWGEPALSHSICSNGRPMRVRYNLVMALLYLRHMSHTQTLWIDALSINQHDISERNQQVRIMGQIYKNSHLTVAWLREEKEGDTHGLNILKLCNVLAQDNTIATEAKSVRISDSIFRDEPSNADSIISSLYGILTSDWFGRLWILQEFTLSPRVIMCCGYKTFLPDGLGLLKNVGRHLPLAVQVLNDPFQVAIIKVTALLQMRDTIQKSSGSDLGTLFLLTVSISKATELLDSVFALLSLIKTGHSTLQPDYNLTADQVFSEAARISSECGRLFNILCLSCRNPDSGLKSSLPSWVPDFADPNITYVQLQSGAAIYSAGGNMAPTFSFDESGLVLRLKGKILDTMSILLSSPPEPDGSRNHIKKWYKKCNKLAYEHGDYPFTERLSSCWWRLAICDVHISERNEYSRASSGFGSFYLDQTITEPFSSDTAEADSLPQEGPLKKEQTEYAYSLLAFSAVRAFWRTEKRYLGWAPQYTHSGDKICLFEGADAPWVIRPKSDRTFQLIGEAYIHGIMDGEAIEWEDSQWQDISLS